MRKMKQKWLYVFFVALLIVSCFSASTQVNAASATKLGSIDVAISRSINGATTTFTATPQKTLYECSGGKYTYQWQVSTDKGSTWSNISGATKSTYSVNTASLNANYRYRCTAKYTFTSDESYALINDAYLIFLNRPAEPEGNQNWWSKVVNHTISNDAKNITNKMSGCPTVCNEAAGIAAMIGMSPEAYTKTANPYHEGAEAFVQACYQFLCGRDADPGGLSSWVKTYNQYKSNTGTVSYGTSTDKSVVNEGAIRVINGIAGSVESKEYMASKYSFNASTGQFTYTKATTYSKTHTFYVNGTSAKSAITAYAITCEDRVGSSSGTLLGTQGTTKSHTNGYSAKGSEWGSSTADNAYYRGYRYTGCSTLTVNGAGKVYRYFELIPDNITYDYQTNGGTAISLAKNTMYLPGGEAIDLTPTATKAGYTFVGWNTNKNARTAITSQTSSASGVTLYAIYRKDYTYTYHALTSNYTATGYVFNNETAVYSDTNGTNKLTYAGYSLSENYPYIGYTLDANKKDNQSLFAGGTVVTDTTNRDIYCVYQATGTLEYYDVNQNLISDKTDSAVYYGTVQTLPDVSFSYSVKSYQPSVSHKFSGWSDGETMYQSGDSLVTASPSVKLYANETPIRVSSIEVSPKSQVINYQSTAQMQVTIAPDDTLDKSVAWSSSNSDIASVDTQGVVTGNAIGTAEITATTKDGTNLSDTATVSVAGRMHYDAETNGGTMIGDSDAYYLQNDVVDLTRTAVKDGYAFIGWNTDKDARIGLTDFTMTESEATLYAIYRKDITYTYHSYDETKTCQIIGYMFNLDGQIYADEAGTTVIQYANHSDLFDLTDYSFVGWTKQIDKTDSTDLIPNGPITEIEDTDFYGVYEMSGILQELKPNGDQFAMQVDTHYGTVMTLPDVVFSYKLDNYSPQQGYSFSGWSYEDRLYQADDMITTKSAQTSVTAVETQILVTDLSVSPTEVELRPEETIQLDVTVTPETALNKQLTFESSDESVVSVDAAGLITAHAIGTADITVSTTDGSNLSQVCHVSVLGRVTYDAVTNGGTECSVEYKDGAENAEVDLSVPANKTGYEFIGWSLSPNAHVSIDSLDYGTNDITLYAVYRRTSVVSYHLYDVGLDVSQNVYCFNNETDYYSDMEGSTKAKVTSYSLIEPDDRYTFIGYTYNPDADSPDDVEDTIYLAVGQPQNIYCLYQLNSELTYYDAKNQLIATEVQQKYAAGPKIESVTFTYPELKSYEPDSGYRFLGWSFDPNRESNVYMQPKDVYTTSALSVELYAVQTPILTDSIEVTPKFASIYTGETVLLTTTVTPETVLDSSVVYTSNDETIASVAQDGLVTGLKPGQTDITVTTKDDSHLSDKATILVADKRHVLIHGKCADSDGHPMKNCNIIIKRVIGSDFVIQTTSDEQGEFTFEPLEFGSYSVTVQDGDTVLANWNAVISEHGDTDAISLTEKASDIDATYQIKEDDIAFTLVKQLPAPTEEPTTESPTTEASTTTEEITTASTTEVVTTTEIPTTTEEPVHIIKTGDSSPVILMIVVAGVFLLVGVILTIKKKK